MWTWSIVEHSTARAWAGGADIPTSHGSSHSLEKLRHGRRHGLARAAGAASSRRSPRPEPQRSSRKSRERAAACPPPPPPSPPCSLANKCLFLQKKEVTGVGAALST